MAATDSSWIAEALVSRLERRRARSDPRGKLWPGRIAFYPGLLPHPWYRLHTAAGSDPVYVWLETAYGMTRVHRADVEIRGRPQHCE